MEKVKRLWSELKEERKFVEKIKEAGEITQKNGHETHFEVALIDNKSVFGKVVEATTVKCLADGLDHLYNGSTPYLVGSFHFHPESNCPIEPSLDDLFLLTTELPHQISPWIAVGQIKDKENVANILFMTPKNRRIAINDINYLEDYSPKQEDVIKNLNKIGVEAIHQIL